MMKLRYVFTLVLMLGISETLIAQDSIEQLEQMAKTAQPGWDQIDVAIGLGRLYINKGDLEKGRDQIALMNELADQYDLPAGKAYALIAENVIAYLYESNSTKAIELCKQAIEVAKEAGDNNAYVYASTQLAENYIWETGQVAEGQVILEKLVNEVNETVALKNIGNVYKNLGVVYSNTGKPDKGIEFYDRAQNTFREMVENPRIDPRINRPSTQDSDAGFHLGSILDSMSDLYINTGNSVKAIELRQQALEIFEERGVALDIAWVHGNLGRVFLDLGRYSESLDHLKKARTIFEATDSKNDLANTRSTMISLFRELRDFNEAEKYVIENLAYFKETNNLFFYTPTLLQAVAIALSQENLSKAEEYVKEAEPLIDSLDNKDRTARFNLLRGHYETKKANFDAAAVYYKNCENLYSELTNVLGGAACEFGLADMFFNAEVYDSAAYYGASVLEKVRVSSDKDLTLDTYALLSKTYAASGDFEKAYENHQALYAYSDSVFTTDAQAKLKEEQVRQNVVSFQREKDLAEQNANLLAGRNQLYIVIGIALFMILLMMAYLYTNLRRVQAKIQSQNVQLTQLNQTRDKFFGIIAHDLRSPMMGLQSVGNQINYFLKKDQKEKLETLSERIENSTKKLTDLLDNLLNWALLQNGMIPYHPEKVNLRETVDSIVELLNPVAETKEVELKNDIDNDSFVHADSKAVNTILRNIIANALKYTEPGGEVAVSVDHKEGKAFISINDTGTGISAEQLPQLFELGKDSVQGTGGEQGSGLGLILCKELVELNKGSIAVKSDLGKGSIFTFDLPQYSDAA